MIKCSISYHRVTFQAHSGLLMSSRWTPGSRRSWASVLSAPYPASFPLDSPEDEAWELARSVLALLFIASLLLSLHHPAVVGLTCTASSQKPVKDLNRLCRRGQRVYSANVFLLSVFILTCLTTMGNWLQSHVLTFSNTTFYCWHLMRKSFP